MIARPIAALILLASSASAAPDFVPKPSQAFEGFHAINAPRTDVPVGALWIEDFGPTGEPAAADNLETIRSLSGLSIDRNLQLNLSASVLSLIGVDPRLRDHYTARFTDLSIVRVKDTSRLSGPKGEPRIVEALKAGSAVVSTDGELSLNARTQYGWLITEVTGDGSAGRTRSKAIEGRDIFVAIRVAATQSSLGRPRTVRMRPGPGGASVGEFEDYFVMWKPENCPGGGNGGIRPCSSGGVSVVRNEADMAAATYTPIDGGRETSIALPVPVSDGHGGLFDHLQVGVTEDCHATRQKCGRELIVRFAGQRRTDARSINARGW
jgi:hypothetical protein